MKVLFGLGFAVVMAAFMVACGGDDDGAKASKVDVALKEWTIAPSTASVKAGDITFTVSNNGTTAHEMVIIKSDLAPDALPVDENGKVLEDDLDAIDEVDAFAAGTTEELTVNLAAGKYILICNILENPPGQEAVSHYQNGMATAFTVE